jgi:hypothetical protein
MTAIRPVQVWYNVKIQSSEPLDYLLKKKQLLYPECGTWLSVSGDGPGQGKRRLQIRGWMLDDLDVDLGRRPANGLESANRQGREE